ncbi:hypothetical protein AWB67_06609 [Caballeronia terrestris]|uniref:Methyltransferase FkbM domain-containing protein n=1 Tax=Caballeronia terrestris TaxID=1226301 RepID=A0A158KSS7_9BURK|nr:FkbM family methyltransferase [Caballeronia terrestris]SAL84167.1 hypothetical protein AWB67_06609 [Caballeronia terrestris]
MLLGLYGAGTLGRALGRTVDFDFSFVDDTPSKLGTAIDGHEVTNLDGFADASGQERRLYICIYQPGFSYLKKRAQIHAAHPHIDVRPFTELFATSASDILPYLFFERVEELDTKLVQYDRVRSLLSDDLSRRTLDGHIKFRRTGRFEDIVSTARRDVPFLVAALSPEVAYVDGGAFDGDTTEDFISISGGKFSRIHIVEPDPTNIERAKGRLNPLVPSDLIVYHEAAIGAGRGLVGFNAIGSVGSAVDESACEKVQSVPLSEFQTDKQLFIKLDIEGSEIDAISAELPFLSRCRPILAISAYHRPDDLLDAVRLIEQTNAGYRLHLRCHGEGGEDLMLYAIPAKR